MTTISGYTGAPTSCFKNPVYFLIKRTVLGNFAQPSVSWGYAKEDQVSLGILELIA